MSFSIDSRPIVCIAVSSADGSSSPGGSGTSSSGCQRRRARKWSIARLCAIRNSQAENGADCHLKRADLLQHLQERLRREVLGVVTVADADVEIAVDPVEVDQVQLLESVAVALLAAGDELPHVLGRLARRRALGGRIHPAFVSPRPGQS